MVASWLNFKVFGASLLATFFLVTCSSLELGESSVVFEWAELDYDWDVIGISKDEALQRGENSTMAVNQTYGAFIPENNAISGLKAWSYECDSSTEAVRSSLSHSGQFMCTDYYVTVPRWLPGVPSTLNKVVPTTIPGEYILQPYPLKETTPPLRYIQSMEIDSVGHMWILDVGRLNTLSDEEDQIPGPATLIRWDMVNDEQLDWYEFPEEVAPHDSSCLNDLAVDVSLDVAYIADSALGTLVVVDMKNKESAVYQDTTTLRDPTFDWVIKGVDLGNETLTAQADGIALTPDMEWVYWCPLQGVQLYRASADSIRALLKDNTQSLSVELVANKTSPAGGMIFSKEGVLYSGGNADPDLNVWRWDSSSDFREEPIAPVLWADTFAFDGVGNVLWTRNDLPDYFNGNMDFTKQGNFQVVQAFVDSVSYV